MENGHQTDAGGSGDETTGTVETGAEAEVLDAGAEDAVDAGAAVLSKGRVARSIETQTEAEEGGGPRFPLRRAVSDWAMIERGPHAVHIRSERIRRAARLFDELAWAEEARRATEEERRTGRPARATAPAAPPPEREVHLVLLPAPPPEHSRRLDAILALGSGPGATCQRSQLADSDSEGDEQDEDRLWEKVRAKIAARRNKFRRMEAGQHEPEPKPAPAAKQNPQRLSADHTGWLSDAKKVAPQLTRQVAPLSTRQMSLPAEQQTSLPVTKQVTVSTVQHNPAANGHGPEATRSWSGKYIEQSGEQTVLRSLGSAVLAKQKLAAKQKARDRLLYERSEAERRQQKARNQRTDAQNKFDKVKGRLTRDSAFEKKGLEALLGRLDGTIREEQRNVDKISRQIAESDADMEELRRRAAT